MSFIITKRKISDHWCFVNNGGYSLAQLSVYEGGEIECWGTMGVDDFLKKVESGWITIDLPDGVELRIGDQGFIVDQAETLNADGTTRFKHKWISKESFVKDVLDSVNVAMGLKSTSELCYEAYMRFCQSKTDENRERLRIAYCNVPEHNRRYVLGDQDLKDRPIKGILGL